MNTMQKKNKAIEVLTTGECRFDFRDCFCACRFLEPHSFACNC
jgi:hypothetical protein